MQQPIRESITSRAEALATQLHMSCLFVVYLFISDICVRIYKEEKRKNAIVFNCSSVTFELNSQLS